METCKFCACPRTDRVPNVELGRTKHARRRDSTLKLKQASAVLGVPPKDLQNFVQAGVLRPLHVGSLNCFNRLLGASSACPKFTRAVSQVPGFATREAETVRVQARAGDEQPVSIPWRGACLTQTT